MATLVDEVAGLEPLGAKPVATRGESMLAEATWRGRSTWASAGLIAVLLPVWRGPTSIWMKRRGSRMRTTKRVDERSAVFVHGRLLLSKFAQ